MSPYSLFPEDLDHVLNHTRELWQEFRGQRLFITGGTGFFGMWLVESFLWANEKLDLGARATVLSRDPQAFLRKAPHLACHEALCFHKGEVRDFAFPEGRFSHVIHAATASSTTLMAENPLEVFEVNVAGTRRVLKFAQRSGSQRFLFTSSGAVYGPQPPKLDRVPESFRGAPDPTDVQSTYAAPGEAKRAGETLCSLYWKQYRLETKIARCFTFVGPHLPLDGKFAIGNFIRDGLQGRPIQIKGSGTPYRSYLYAADLAIWLWTLLFRGQAGSAYNVGSELSTQIIEVARRVSESLPRPVAVSIGRATQPSAPSERYVPSTEKARRDLGVTETIGLADAIRRTLAWAKTRSD